MQAATVFVGLASGVLLARMGLAFWGGSQRRALSRILDALGWVATLLLALGAASSLREDPEPSALALRAISMAAVGTLPHTSGSRLSSRHEGLAVLPASALAAIGLFELTAARTGGASGSPQTAVALATLVCGGLGTWILGKGLCEIAVPSSHVSWPAIAYVPLTLLVGGITLANLWQSRTAWSGDPIETRLAGAWLAWSAVWVMGPERPRLRAALAVPAALALILPALWSS